MLLVGLTGGIGSGKSSVARMLADRGAVVIDADELARRAVARGTPGFEAVRARFGPGVLTGDGDLDRRVLGDRVFADPEQRRALEAIVHPEVARLFAEEVARHRGTDAIVVYQVPLLVERGLASAFDVVVTVRAPAEVRAARVAAERGMSSDEVRLRMASQVPDEARAAVADVVLDNAGTLTELEGAVADLWERLREGAAAG